MSGVIHKKVVSHSSLASVEICSGLLCGSGWPPFTSTEVPGLKLSGSLGVCLQQEVQPLSDGVGQWALVSACSWRSAVCVRRALTLGGGLPQLEHLNLSGCLTVTGAGLQELVSACPSLKDEHFYYCDNINGNVFVGRCDAFLGSDARWRDFLKGKEPPKPHLF